jgi:hypothetical protein
MARAQASIVQIADEFAIRILDRATSRLAQWSFGRQEIDGGAGQHDALSKAIGFIVLSTSRSRRVRSSKSLTNEFQLPSNSALMRSQFGGLCSASDSFAARQSLASRRRTRMALGI